MTDETITPQQIQAARALLGLTQPGLAKILGCSQETISRFKTGRLGASSSYYPILLGYLYSRVDFSNSGVVPIKQSR